MPVEASREEMGIRNGEDHGWEDGRMVASNGVWCR